MAEIVSISLSRQDIDNAKQIKKLKGIGKSDIFKFGLDILINDKLKDYEELKEANEKLYNQIKKLQKQIWELDEYQTLKQTQHGVFK